MRSDIESSLAEAADAVARLRADDGALGAIEAAAGLLVGAFRARRRVFSCGNGADFVTIARRWRRWRSAIRRT
jgi:D-sedoheptulose 7-phosphate isomerase